MCFLHAFYHERENANFKRKDLCELVFFSIKLESNCVKRKSGKYRTKTNFLRYQQLLNMCSGKNRGSHNKVAFIIPKVKYHFTSDYLILFISVFVEM